MFTCCPSCRTNLAVTVADLRVGQGYVRCGRCNKVFNSLLTLTEDVEEEEQSGLAASGTTTVPALDDSDEDMPPEFTAAVQEADAPSAESPMGDRAGLSQYEVDEVDDQATGTFETIILEGDGFLQTEEHVDEAVVNAELAALTRQMEDHARAALPETPAISVAPAVEPNVALTTDDPAPDFEFDANAAVGNRRRHHWVWWLVACVLTLALAALLLHHNRQTLVALPWAEQPVQTVYGWFGKTVEPAWDIHAYELRQLSGDLAIGNSDSFTVQASIRNRASYKQPLPLIRVTLHDRFGNVLSTTDIAPTEYLLGAMSRSARMAPDQRLDATLHVSDPTHQAAGFDLDSCLTGADGKTHCANGP